MASPTAGGSSIIAGTTPRRSLTLGTIPAAEIAAITDGKLAQDVPVALNRLVTEYDHILICGPVFPHEVAGLSGGAKYLFPGIAAPQIIHFTHWLGALITSYEIIGTIDTPVRAVIDRAAAFLDTPVSLVALVTSHDGVAGVFCGDVHAGVARRGPPLVAPSHRVDRQAVRSRRLRDALDVRGHVDGGQGDVQDGAGHGRWRRSDHLRAARQRSQPRPRRAARRNRVPLSRLLRRPVAAVRALSRRHPRAFDAPEGIRHVRRDDRRRNAACRGDAGHRDFARALRAREPGIHRSPRHRPRRLAHRPRSRYAPRSASRRNRCIASAIRPTRSPARLSCTRDRAASPPPVRASP